MLFDRLRSNSKRPENGPRVIVTLTSYPPRMQHVGRSLETIFNQTRIPDAVYLWLIASDFPEGLASLPEDVLALRKKGLEVRFADIDLKVHNKYFWTLREHNDDIIITVDDDVLYRPTVLETLLDSYRSNPQAVSAMRAHRITFDETGAIRPYTDWVFEYTEQLGQPRMDLLATGVCGVLYPPHSLDSDLMTVDEIQKTCIEADDIWLKVIELTKGIPVVVCDDEKPSHILVGGSQAVARWPHMNEGGGNDVQIKNALAAHNEYCGENDTLIDRIRQGAR